MVVQSEPTNHHTSDEEEDDKYDVISVISSENEDADKYALAVPNNERDLTFGNIAVTNSADVHFGNKTFYQGPVTIKQILYTNPKDEQVISENILSIKEEDIKGQVNPTFIVDHANEFVKTHDSKLCAPQHKETKKKWITQLQHKHLLVVIILVAFLLIIFITTLSLFLTKNSSTPSSNNGVPVDSKEQDKNTPIEGPIDPTVNLTLSGKLRIVSRLEWLAQPPSDALDNLTLPVPYVIISHTATEGCQDQAACTFHVRFIQTFHMESRHWYDISYNYLVGGDGFAYEGRGFKKEGAHTYGYNARSVGISFIGTFNSALPPARQILAAQQLIKKGVEEGAIAGNYKLLAARQLQTTQSPGKALYENMKTWPHWSPEP